MNSPFCCFCPHPSDEATGSSGYAAAGNEPGADEGLRRRARETAEHVKEKASDIASDAKARGAAMASERKAELADRIDRVSTAVRDRGKAVEPEDPNIAWLTDRAADRIQSVADYVRDRDFLALRTDAESFARRHPAAVLGGAFVAGLVIANLLKAGRRDERAERDEAASWDDDYSTEAADDPSADAPAPRPRSAPETVMPDDSEAVREAGPVPMGSAGNL